MWRARLSTHDTVSPRTWPRRDTWLLRSERGSAAVELTLATPLIIVLALFTVFMCRMVDAQVRLNDTAHQAARAASMARSVNHATVAANSAAHAALVQAGITCQTLGVQTDTADMQPGATVAVIVSCTVGLEDLTLLSVPGTWTLEANYRSIMDKHRGVAVEPMAGGEMP